MNINLQLSVMYKKAPYIYQCWGKVGKNYPDWSLTKSLSFHEIWLKSVNNLDTDLDPEKSQNLTECSLHEGPRLQKVS